MGSFDKAERTILDLLIAIALFLLLVWCVFLAWGAYCQHWAALQIDQKVLHEAVVTIKQHYEPVGCGTNSLNSTNFESMLHRLEITREKLLDANTLSFLYQFVTVIIMSISGAALGIMYNRLKEAAKSAREARDIAKGLTRIVQEGHALDFVLIAKFSIAYAACLLFLETGDGEDEQTCRGIDNGKDEQVRRIAGYLEDVQTALEDVLREKRGINPDSLQLLLELSGEVVSLAGRLPENLSALYVNRIRPAASACERILKDNGSALINDFNARWKKLTGKNYENNPLGFPGGDE